MATNAEELLNGLSEEDMITYVANSETEPHIVVNSDRTITVPDSLKCIGVYKDHNIETVIFDCPRYWDGHDLSAMHIYINSRCAINKSGKKPNSYLVNDVSVDEANPDIIHFSWTISEYVTEVEEKIDFLVCAKETDLEGVETRRWHSKICQDMYICEGFDTVHEIVQENPDVIEQLLLRVEVLEKGGASDEAIASAVEAYLLEHPIEGGTISDEQIAQAVSEYMGENPIETGATQEQVEQIEKNTKDIGELSEQIADKATIENNVIKFFKSGETDTELFSVDVSSIGGAGGLDLKNLTLSVSQVGEYQRLSMSDGTTTKYVDIPIAVITDEQVQTAVKTWLDEHPESTTTISYSYNERGSFLTVEDDGSVVTERVFDKYANGYTKNLFTDYTFTRITGVENASYITSDFIKVIPGVPYCASRKTTSVYTYDSSKNVLATTGITLNTTGIIFNGNVAYIRVEFFYQSAYTYAVQMGETYTLKYPDSYIPEYSVNANFDKMLDTQVSRRLKRNAIRDFGRYGGDIDLNQYTKMFNYTTSSTNVELIDITDDSDWYGYSVRQVARLTHISTSTANFGFWFCKSSGTEQLIPSEQGFAVGDTMYVGFMGRANRVLSPTNGSTTNEKNTVVLIKDYEPIIMDTIPHFYEYAIPITEENIDSVLAIAFLLPPSEDWIEITNLYMSNKSNVNKCIFEDLARKEVVDKIISHKFKDKTWLALGDSITNQGKYITALQKYFPFGTIDNQGIGGSTIVDKEADSDGCRLIDTLEENVKNVHVISIGYGTNDTNYIKSNTTWSVGELADYGSEFDKNTFYGAYQYTIEKILSWNPTVPIVLIVPTVAMIVDSTTMTNKEKRELRNSVAQAVRDVANFYGYPYVDLYHDSGMNEFNRLTYAPDGVHPNDEFGDITARLMIPVFEHMKV